MPIFGTVEVVVVVVVVVVEVLVVVGLVEVEREDVSAEIGAGPEHPSRLSPSPMPIAVCDAFKDLEGAVLDEVQVAVQP